MALPETMRVATLDAPIDDDLEAARAVKIVERPVPKPGPGQVLVKMAATPCNPSDQSFLRGTYEAARSLPDAPGFEGAGTVVASGGGLLAGMLKGKRVACGGQDPGDGTWAEYFVSDAKLCFPLRKDLSDVAGATLLVNPLTATAFVDIAHRAKERAILMNAGASQLAQLTHTFARRRGIEVVRVVRRAAQVEALKAKGVEHVLDSSAPDHANTLARLTEKLDVKTAFDAVGGANTGALLRAVRPGGRVFVYGLLSGENPGDLDVQDLVFRRKRVDGFHLTPWMEQNGLFWTLSAGRRIQAAFAAGEIETNVRAEVGFEAWSGALADYAQEMTGGKVILRPDQA